jgi:hypothetical protein
VVPDDVTVGQHDMFSGTKWFQQWHTHTKQARVAVLGACFLGATSYFPRPKYEKKDRLERWHGEHHKHTRFERQTQISHINLNRTPKQTIIHQAADCSAPKQRQLDHYLPNRTQRQQKGTAEVDN